MLAVTSNRRTPNHAEEGRSTLFLRSVVKLLVTANVVHSSLILLTLVMEAICFSVTSIITRDTRRNIPEDDILHSHWRETFKSYIALTYWTL
jgi:hypothetical protein